jgi:hypothetical protein
MSCAGKRRRAPNEEEELDALVSNGGGNHAKLHSRGIKSADTILSGRDWGQLIYLADHTALREVAEATLDSV